MDMDHGDHTGHGGHDMPMPVKCAMNMLWNTQIVDTCIVFPQWHIGSNGAFMASFFAIVALGIFYEYLKAWQKSFDRRVAASLAGKDKGKARKRSIASEYDSEPENAGPPTGRKIPRAQVGIPVPLFTRVLRAVLYAATVFLSFFLMLVFMTYNAYLIVAVVLGAGLGHYVFGVTLDVNSIIGDDKGMACH